jgi:spore maturation protein CgeB
MNVLFLEEDYNLFFTRYFNEHPEAELKSFQELTNYFISLNYYKVGAYAHAFEKMNVPAEMIILNCLPLQLKWMKEHKYGLYVQWKLGRSWRSFQARVLGRFDTFQMFRNRILLEQVRALKPDVIYIHSGVPVDSNLLLELKKNVKLLVLQWNTELLEAFPFEKFDAVFTSVSRLQNHFSKSLGVPSSIIQQAFEEDILTRLPVPLAVPGKAVFIGSFNPLIHQNRIDLIQYLVEHSDLDIYAPDVSAFNGHPDVARHFKGSVGGLKMYETYRNYKIAVHFPMQMSVDKNSNEAGAKRLFEVTGVGTMLLCLEQDNLKDFFEIGKEIVTFKDKEDCLVKLNYYLAHEEERAAIAKAGQMRTLREHTFARRAEQLLDELTKMGQTK